MGDTLTRAMATSREQALLKVNPVGQEIRGLRKASGKSLMTLSEAAGISAGYLSQVERGLSNPTVNVLKRIASALGVSVAWLFPSPSPNDSKQARRFTVRANARRQMTYANGVDDQLLVPHLEGKLEMLLCHLQPGAQSGEGGYQHQGEECGLVLEGELELWIGETRLHLKKGDSFSFPSTKAHRYCNPGAVESVIVWVVTPPTF